MASSYLIFHSIRVARRALGTPREGRRTPSTLPGNDRYGTTTSQVASAMAFMDRIAARNAETIRIYGVHGFIKPSPETVTDWEDAVRSADALWWQKCVTCKGSNDGVVHQPTWSRYPDGSPKPKDDTAWQGR
jgi:hypothetical protein